MNSEKSKLSATYIVAIWLGAGCCTFLAVLYGMLPDRTGLRFVGLGVKALLTAAFIMLHVGRCGGKAFCFASIAVLTAGITELAVTVQADELRYSNLIAFGCHILAGLISLIVMLMKREVGPYMKSTLQCLVFFLLIALMMNLSIVNVLSLAGCICYILLFIGVYEPKRKEATHGL